MADKAWKRTERAVASMIGGVRVPITGRQRGDAKDINHDWISCEVKHRANPPGWAFLWDAMDQAIQSANSGDLPMVVVHKTRVPHNKNMVVILMEDFVNWFVEGVDDAHRNKWERLRDGEVSIPGFENAKDVLKRDSNPERAGLPRMVSPNGEVKRRITERIAERLANSGRRPRCIPEEQEGSSKG